MAIETVNESETTEDRNDGFPAGLRDHFMEVAAKIWPQGTALRCARCGRVQKLTVEDVARVLASGSPKCHGERMWIGDMDQN